MDHALAKELKEAGFPQGDGHYMDAAGASSLYQHRNSPHIFERDVFVPTLDELIEACSGTSFRLFISADGSAGVQLEQVSLEDVVFYSTPKEAVARLWLALNRK